MPNRATRPGPLARYFVLDVVAYLFSGPRTRLEIAAHLGQDVGVTAEMLAAMQVRNMVIRERLESWPQPGRKPYIYYINPTGPFGSLSTSRRT